MAGGATHGRSSGVASSSVVDLMWKKTSVARLIHYDCTVVGTFG